MPQEFNITDDDIQYAEGILLPKGKHFNDVRVAYIKDFRTMDVQAVPGSGKTTALLAKLLILDRKLPFKDGEGIVVLSHTNAAIDEIKDKLKNCSKIFEYPNFIGTIQSFVDEFLAVPFFCNWQKKKPVRIDNEIFWEAFLRKYPQAYQTALKKRLGNKFRTFVEEVSVKADSLVHFYTMESMPIPNIGVKTPTYTHLVNTKKELLSKGILNYNDAYSFAFAYIRKCPQVIKFIQHRFKYVFVDEMQDMDMHQYDLIEKVFYENDSISIIQRIGDKNQAIFNTVKSDEVWNDRNLITRLSDSMRLSQHIASIVSNFALHRGDGFVINGLNECSLKPHLIIYEDHTLSNVIPYFSEIVRTYKNNGMLPDFGRYPVKAVAWNTDWKEEAQDDTTKVRLVDYHKGYSKEKMKPKNDYQSLKSYLLYYDKGKKTLESIRKNILNAILKVLRLENILYNEERYYTKRLLLDSIRLNDPVLYEEFKLYLYKWSIGIICENIENVLTEIREYLPTLYFFNGRAINLSLRFINGGAEIDPLLITQLHTNEVIIHEGIPIEVTSVHAVKGQTHCATLYLESYFQKDGTGVTAKSYESQRLMQQFLGNALNINGAGERIKQSAKMAFVGFSRPTNLLCVAVHKTRFDSGLSTIDGNTWEIVEVPVPVATVVTSVSF